MEPFLILAALDTETREGWVWLPLPSKWAADVVSIKHDSHSVICERRVVDENFRRLYESETRATLPTNESFIVINAWYRQRLGINSARVKVSLEIREERGLWEKHVSVFWHHPSAIVRSNIQVALVSIGLGIVGLVLGIVSLCRR
jgi:hypothetical protein